MAYDTEESDEFYIKKLLFSHQIPSPFDDSLEAQDDIVVESQ